MFSLSEIWVKNSQNVVYRNYFNNIFQSQVLDSASECRILTVKNIFVTAMRLLYILQEHKMKLWELFLVFFMELDTNF